MSNPIKILTDEPTISEINAAAELNPANALFENEEKLIEPNSVFSKALIYSYSYNNASGRLLFGFDSSGKINELSVIPNDLSKIEEMTIISDLISALLRVGSNIEDILQNSFPSNTNPSSVTNLFRYLLDLAASQNKPKSLGIDAISQ